MCVNGRLRGQTQPLGSLALLHVTLDDRLQDAHVIRFLRAQGDAQFARILQSPVTRTGHYSFGATEPCTKKQ